MRRAEMWRGIVCGAVIGLSAIACADSDREQIDRLNNPPAPQGDSDTTPPTVDDLTTGETVVVPGVSSDVTVIIDRRGIPHIYGKKMTDVLRAQGYIMARDRFPQMEFIRRSVTGTLTEALEPAVGTAFATANLVPQDAQALTFGFARIAQQLYTSLAADDIVKVYVDAYVAGVNTYIAQIAAEAAKGAAANLSRFVPQGDNIFLAVLASPHFRPWTSVDVLALARYQAFSLSFDETDVSRTLGILAASDFSGEAQIHMINAAIDMQSPAPGRAVYTTDAGGPGAVSPYPARTAPDPVSFTAATTESVAKFDPASVKGLRAFVQGVRSLKSIVGTKERGSNNWVVSGQHTASGAAMLANDPHLTLSSPALWYYSHLIASDDNIDVEGVTFAGLGGVTLGFTKDLAWGATVTNYDVTDFYQFGPMSIDSGTHALNVITQDGTAISVPVKAEVIHRVGGDSPVPYYEIPDFGLAVLDPETGTPTGISVRTVNSELSNEFGFFYRLYTAKTVEDGRKALNDFFKVGSQNFVFATASGDISWQTYSRVPVRPAAALGWDGLTPPLPFNAASTNYCPIFVLPAADAFKWTGAYQDNQLPALLNPAKGWIATANQDVVGFTKDGNPCNDGIYLGGTYDPGYREFRIAQKLDALSQRGGITVADMQDVQASSMSSLGETLRTPIVDSLKRTIAAAAFDADSIAFLTDVSTRLQAWTLATPAGTDTTDSAVIADSVATTIFNVGLTRIIALALGDERQHCTDATETYAGLDFTPEAAPLLERVMLGTAANEGLGMATFNGTDSDFWDNIDTEDVETRDQIIALAFLGGGEPQPGVRDVLRQRLGTDVSQWRWGKLHTVTFTTVIPASGLDAQSIPSAADPQFAAGFPRHSDWGAVDVGNFNLWNSVVAVPASGPGPATAGLKKSIGLKDYAYGSGPSQRLVVEMLPDGPVAYDAIPGGQSSDPNSKHHADEAALWQANKAPQLNYTEADVVANAELKIIVKAP
jgi:penicillin amidase